MIEALVLATAMNTSPKCYFNHDFRGSISSEQGAAAGSTGYDVRLTNTGRTCVTRAAAPQFGVTGKIFAVENNSGARELTVKHGATVHSLLSVTNPGVFTYKGKKVINARTFFLSAPVSGRYSFGKSLTVKSKTSIQIAVNVPRHDGNALIIGPLSPGRK